MSTPRISQNAEAARAAALQAEFNEKKWVWVPDDRDGYLAGWVAKEEDEMGEVVIAAGGDVRPVLPLDHPSISVNAHENRYAGSHCTPSQR
jgi:Myosin N-terminal SH3-like domain